MKLTIQLILPLVGVAAVGSAQAATTLIGGATNNGNFETPDVGGATNFNTSTITNWSNWTEVDTADNDTGVYDSGTAGSQAAYIQPGGAIVNMTTHLIALGDTFDFGFTDVIGARDDATMQLVYNNGGVLTAITGTDLVGNNNVDGQVYAGSFTVTVGDAWIGNAIGVGLFTGGNYPEFDNITLEVTPVPEPSSTVLLGLGALALTLRRRK